MNQNQTYIFVDKYETFDVPRSVAVCPYCQGTLTASVWEWEEESEGIWTAMSVEVDCDKAPDPDLEPDEWDDFMRSHTEMPYVYWLPMTEQVQEWISEHFRFLEKEDMPTNVDKFFVSTHLPSHLQEVAKPIEELAKLMDESLPDGSEKSAGMRKLLEAKDCFVRAKL